MLHLQRRYGNRHVQRMVASVQRERDKGEGSVAPDVESAIATARGGGQAMDRAARRQMESAFGADFQDVRVHTDSTADGLNRKLDAIAFTTGHDIFFSQGAYQPETSTGKELLAHELTHVVQQSGAAPQRKMVLGESGDVYEQEADRVATAVRSTLEHGIASEQGVNSGQPQSCVAVRESENRATASAVSLDVLSNDSRDPSGPYLDGTIMRQGDGNGGGGGDGGGGDGGAGDGGGGQQALDKLNPGKAVPVNLQQTVTAWTPGADQYGFQLSFQCGSSSGSVADLQAQAPNLTWREYVTYSRNDFAHHINPPSPTILPPGGVSFAPARTTVVNANTLAFNNVADTHWMPTSAVRADEYALALAAPRPLPAIMESSQLYQYSADGSTWTTFAGPFTLRRTLSREDGSLYFTTNKEGINSVKENYKP